MTAAQCPMRHMHTTTLSPMLAAAGYVLLRCPCGQRYAVLVDRSAN